MEKTRYKVTLNWQGQVFETYHQAKDESQALRSAIRKLADEVGYTNVYVRNHIMSGNRYEVIVK
jgi:hypothetical protein